MENGAKPRPPPKEGVARRLILWLNPKVNGGAVSFKEGMSMKTSSGSFQVLFWRLSSRRCRLRRRIATGKAVPTAFGRTRPLGRRTLSRLEVTSSFLIRQVMCASTHRHRTATSIALAFASNPVTWRSPAPSRWGSRRRIAAGRASSTWRRARRSVSRTTGAAATRTRLHIARAFARKARESSVRREPLAIRATAAIGRSRRLKSPRVPSKSCRTAGVCTLRG